MPANAARVVYGTIVVAVLLSAESAERETYAETVIGVVVALLLYWFAHAYAESAAERIAERARLTLDELVRSMLHESPIILGAALPLVPVLIWWLTGGSLTSAVTAAIWTAAGMIVVYELIAGLRAKLNGRELIVQVAVGAALGTLVIVLKTVLH
jgi:Na+/H+ antiporter NhaC